MDGVPAHLAVDYTKQFIIFSTSPSPRRAMKTYEKDHATRNYHHETTVENRDL